MEVDRVRRSNGFLPYSSASWPSNGSTTILKIPTTWRKHSLYKNTNQSSTHIFKRTGSGEMIEKTYHQLWFCIEKNLKEELKTFLDNQYFAAVNRFIPDNFSLPQQFHQEVQTADNQPYSLIIIWQLVGSLRMVATQNSKVMNSSIPSSHLVIAHTLSKWSHRALLSTYPAEAFPGDVM